MPFLYQSVLSSTTILNKEASRFAGCGESCKAKEKSMYKPLKANVITTVRMAVKSLY